MVSEHHNDGRFFLLLKVIDQLLKCPVGFMDQRQITLCGFCLLLVFNRNFLLEVIVRKQISAVVLNCYIKHKQRII